jgi:hypothetical protein
MDNQIWDKHNISYFLPIESIKPPSIANLVNKRYMVFTGQHGGWFLIDDTVTYDMVLSRHINYISPTAQAKQLLMDHGSKEWKIPGSKGNEYTVTLKVGEFSCECVGFGFRRKCKHVELAKTKMNKSKV